MLTWKCHICKEERPDDKISVLSKPMVISGRPCGEQNIRYCNDRPACLEGAKVFSFDKNGREPGETKSRLVRADTYPTLADFQNANCKGCKFADKPLVGTGRACCTYIGNLDHSGGICHNRRES